MPSLVLDPSCVSTDVWEAWWQSLAAARRRAHAGPCPAKAAPYSDADPRGDRLPESCRTSGCLDLLHELFGALAPRLAQPGSPPVNPAAYWATAAANHQTDAYHKRRTARGGVAKPDRRRGVVPGRIAAALSDPWQDRLLTEVLAFAAADGPLGAPEWPYERWAALRAAVLDAPAGRPADIRADVDRVLEVALEVAGSSWVSERILDPLRRRSSVPLDERTTEPDSTDVAVRSLALLYREHRSKSHRPEEAARLTAVASFGEQVERGAAARLLADPRYLRELAEQFEGVDAAVGHEGDCGVPVRRVSGRPD
jgi:hypothetical protein